jgi:nucleotide-binding universal stress UspA family protein
MYKHILIATDGSELAGKTVTAGLALAKRLDAKVTAVTAIQPWLLIAAATQQRLSWSTRKRQSRTPHVSAASTDRRPRQELQDHHEGRHSP